MSVVKKADVERLSDVEIKLKIKSWKATVAGLSKALSEVNTNAELAKIQGRERDVEFLEDHAKDLKAKIKDFNDSILIAETVLKERKKKPSKPAKPAKPSKPSKPSQSSNNDTSGGGKDEALSLEKKSSGPEKKSSGPLDEFADPAFWKEAGVAVALGALVAGAWALIKG